MNIGVDIRCLMHEKRTGVGEYTFELLNAVFSFDKENQYFLFYNSNKDVSAHIPQWSQDNVHYVFTRYPNKLLNLLLFLKVLKLDNLIIKKLAKPLTFPPLPEMKLGTSSGEGRVGLDTWFSANLNFTRLSKHIKHILTIHDLSFEFFPEYFTFKQRLWHKFLNPRKQCQRADIVLTPSENTKRDVADMYQLADSKFQVLRPGISCHMKHIKYNMEQTKQKYQLTGKYILYLGTLEPRKNVEAIIEAYKINQELGIRNYGLVITGASGWKNKKLLKLITETDGVKYIGYVDEKDKPSLYQAASLFVFPSFYEGFGLPVLEAMDSGVPVITSNRSSLPEVVGEAGYLVNPHNVVEIAEAMKKILSDHKLRDILVERGKKKAGEFEWGKTAGEFVKLLNN